MNNNNNLLNLTIEMKPNQLSNITLIETIPTTTLKLLIKVKTSCAFLPHYYITYLYTIVEHVLM